MRVVFPCYIVTLLFLMTNLVVLSLVLHFVLNKVLCVQVILSLEWNYVLQQGLNKKMPCVATMYHCRLVDMYCALNLM